MNRLMNKDKSTEEIDTEKKSGTFVFTSKTKTKTKQNEMKKKKKKIFVVVKRSV